MNIARSAALIGNLFGRTPGVSPTLHAAALGGLMAFGFAASAHAAVVVSPVSNLAVPVTTAGIYINVVSGASGVSPAAAPGWDINPWGTQNAYLYGTAATATTGFVLASDSKVANLALGTVVGAATPAFGEGAVSTTAGATAWTLNSTDYFGFRFIGDDTLEHYGYGSMIVGATQLSRTIGNIWYESDANTAITVGATTTAVPEASSGAMLLAGAGALAAMALRRRRQTGV